MDDRPILNRQLESKVFKEFYYLKEELAAFCKENGLPATGGKLELTERIAAFLDTGEVTAALPSRKKAVPIGEITLTTRIEEDYVSSEKHRQFFKEQIGENFKFNVAFQKWMNINAGKTYQDAVDAYDQIKKEQKKSKTTIGRQFEYNTYIRDFFEDNKGRSLDDAIKCWKYKKQQRGHNRYERSDLASLEMNAQIKTIEEVMLNALPSLNTLYYDEWRLRFAGGYTNRANSVNVIAPSTIPLREKIHHCEKIYTAEKLPTVFRISPYARELDGLLEEAGYELVTKTDIMTMDLRESYGKELTSIVTEGIDPNWQSHYFRLNETNPEKIPYAEKVQALILDQVLCAMLIRDGEVLACGLAVVEDEYVGLYDIIVSPAHRHVGYGEDICASLLEQAYEHGARKAYIQVVASNTNAVKLYQKLGYQKLYDYWYRVKDFS